jgi:hypothetical protein
MRVLRYMNRNTGSDTGNYRRWERDSGVQERESKIRYWKLSASGCGFCDIVTRIRDLTLGTIGDGIAILGHSNGKIRSDIGNYQYWDVGSVI